MRAHIDKMIGYSANRTRLLLPFGCKNAYSQPKINYELMDTLIDEFNTVGKRLNKYPVRLVYSKFLNH